MRISPRAKAGQNSSEYLDPIISEQTKKNVDKKNLIKKGQMYKRYINSIIDEDLPKVNHFKSLKIKKSKGLDDLDSKKRRYRLPPLPKMASTP